MKTPQALINLSQDIKAERVEQKRDRLRNEFADAYERKPWAVSLAHGDLGKVMSDLEHGRVTEAELWNASDCGRISGTLDPRIATRLCDLLSMPPLRDAVEWQIESSRMNVPGA